MSGEKKTHRVVKNPQISGRYLADYMAGSEMNRRAILRACKYQPVARVVQHNEAKAIISKFLRSGSTDTSDLKAAAQKLKTQMADSDFDRDLLDHNADYIDRFVKASALLDLPDCDRLDPGRCPSLSLHGVKVTADIQLRLRRVTTTNKVRVGVASLRYAKGKALKDEIADWQSAFLFGYLSDTNTEEGSEPEHKLCITIDGYSGKCHAAPTNSATRFKNMVAACEAIAERWDNIAPPAKAIL